MFHRPFTNHNLPIETVSQPLPHNSFPSTGQRSRKQHRQQEQTATKNLTNENEGDAQI